MGCVDDRGRLYVGDAAGLNLKKDELEKQLPNRVLQLTDTKGDGHYDKVTVFADKMTFPQGACWLNGSLYVASPPGIWKLTDTDGDGVITANDAALAQQMAAASIPPAFTADVNGDGVVDAGRR